MDCNLNNRSGNARGDADDIGSHLAIPCPRVLDVSVVQRERRPASENNQPEGDLVVEQSCFHGSNTAPMAQLNRTVRATKKSGRCQTLRDRPVGPIIATTSQAAKKPAKPITASQAKPRSRNSNSGRFTCSARSSIYALKPSLFKFWVFYNSRFDFPADRLVEPLVGRVQILVDRVERCFLALFQIRGGVISRDRLMSSGILVGAPGKRQKADNRQDCDCSEIGCF